MTGGFRRGLVVGKFSPLHLGHELLIRHAIETCEEVAIISYSKPELPGCDAGRREKWVAELFPTAHRLILSDSDLKERLPKECEQIEMPGNEADDYAHRRFVGFLCKYLLGRTVDAVFTSEHYGQGFARDLTHYFRESDPHTPAVRHVCVDLKRCHVPVSGTLIRSDVHANRQWLSPVVYASFVQRICILGGESSGKSTLAAALARSFNTVHVPEYGRELWEEKDGALAFEDMLLIAETQMKMEEAAARRARRFLFCDTSPLTTLFYSRQMFGRADPALEKLAERSYDLIVLCAPDFPFVQDGTRQDETFRQRQHTWYVEELNRYRIPFLVATGHLENRIALIRETVLNMSKLGQVLNVDVFNSPPLVKRLGVE